MSDDTNIIETSDDGRYRVRLVIEEGPENPRRFYDHITHVITPTQSHYIDVDEDGGPLQYGWDHFRTRAEGEAMFVRWARIFHGAVVVKHHPTYGARSLWYLMPEGLAEIGIPAEQYIGADIKEYQAWAEGEVYRYVIEECVEWKRRDGKEGELTTYNEVDDFDEVDASGPWYGYEDAEKYAREAFADYLTDAS